jgi:ketosteroid isomerase-like protein
MRCAVLLLVLTAPLAAQSAPGDAIRTAIRAEIQTMNDSMTAAFNAGNPAGVARFYADNARLRGSRGPEISGRSAVDGYWAGIRNPVRWRLEVLDVGGNRDLAYQVGRSHLTSRGQDGQERTYTTDFVVIWERQPDRSLRITYDLWN